MTRLHAWSLVVLLAGLQGLRAEEYHGAKVKGHGERGTVLLDVDGKEVKVTPRLETKAFDANGKQLTQFGDNYRLYKEGNVLDITTEKSRDGKMESVREAHLVQGELAQPGKAVRTGKSEKSDGQIYKNATIKEYRKPYLVFTADDKEIKVLVGNGVRAFDSAGKPLAKSEKLSSLKAGKVIDVTVKKSGSGGKEYAAEIHFQGD